jgi:hypothetical protein
MNHEQAKRYLEKMFTHQGSGNLFGIRPVVFPRMSGAKPTNAQRSALAKAITSDDSKEGKEFMYKLLRKIISRHQTRPISSSVLVLSPQTLARVRSEKGLGLKEVLPKRMF